MLDSPLADPGVRYSLTGLVWGTHTQKGWGDHRGADRCRHGFQFAKNCQCAGIGRATTLPGFEPCMLFFACRSKGIGSRSQLMTYEIPEQKFGPEQKQRNVPVRAILGQYSSGLPVLRFKSVTFLLRRAAARRWHQQQA